MSTDTNAPQSPADPHQSNKANNWKGELFRILRSGTAFKIGAVLVALVAMRIGYTIYDQRNTSSRNLTVHVFQVKPETLDSSLALPGNIEAIQQASMYAHVGGYLKKIYVDEGDQVKKDQLLAEIDAPDVTNEYSKLKAELALKRVTAKRYRELLDERVISQQEFDNIDTAYEETKSKFDNAAANVEFTKIRAPFDGSIARRNKYPGDLISMEAKDQTPIFVIVNENELRVVVNVPQSDLASLKLGDLVDIKIDSFPNQIFKGAVSRFDALLDAATKTERVLIDIANPDGKLHAGMFASVDLHFAHRDNAIMISNDAIEKTGSQAYVYIDTKEGGKDIAKKTPVTLGPQDLSRTEILSGLEANQTVIRKGMLAIHDGTVIVPLLDQTPPAQIAQGQVSEKEPAAAAPVSSPSPSAHENDAEKALPVHHDTGPSSQADGANSPVDSAGVERAAEFHETSSR